MSDIPALAPEAFHGLAGRIVGKIEPHTESDPAALLLQLLAGFGNVAGRGAYFQHEADRHYPNLFVALVGETSRGRKGTSFGQAKARLAEAFPQWHDDRITGGLSTGEGLIHAVRDPVSGPVVADKNADAVIKVLDPGVPDKRLFVIETEFGGVLRKLDRDGNTLSAVVRDAWDRGRLSTLTKTSQTRATDAHVSIVGHITGQELVRHLGAVEIANGFGNRFLWIMVQRTKLLPFGGSIDSVDFSGEYDELRAAADFASAAGRIQWSPRAKEAWAEIYERLSSGGTGIFGALTGRAEAQVTRLALIYALLDRSRQIREEHLAAALAVWERCLWTVRELFGEGAGDPVAQKILAALKASAEGLGRTGISNALGRNHNQRRIEQALRDLEAEGLVWRESAVPKASVGRTAEVWRAA